MRWIDPFTPSRGINALTLTNPIRWGESQISEFYWRHQDQIPTVETESVLWRHNDHLWEIGTKVAPRAFVQEFYWVAYPWDQRVDFDKSDPLGAQSIPVHKFGPFDNVGAQAFTPPKGDWAIRAVARGINQDTVVSSEQRFAVVEVTSVEWEGVVESDGETNFTPGDQVDSLHAERNSASGPLHNSVRVKVKIDPAIQFTDTVLNIRLYDPDNALDGDRDPNDTDTVWAHDNLTGGDKSSNPRCTPQNVPDHQCVATLTDGLGVGFIKNPNPFIVGALLATVKFTSGQTDSESASDSESTDIVEFPNRQPGNNYRAVVHDETVALDGTDYPLSVDDVGDRQFTTQLRYDKEPYLGIIEKTGDYEAWTGGIVDTNASRELLLRRTLALEFDSYRQPVAGDGVFGEAVDDPMNFTSFAPPENAEDDNVVAAKVAEALKAILEQAAIDVTRDRTPAGPAGEPANPADDLVNKFKKNSSSENIVSAFKNDRDYANTSDAWSFQVVAIYELHVDQDYDDETDANYGRSIGATAALASEVARDLYAATVKAGVNVREFHEFLALAATHEVLHGFVGSHLKKTEDDIMTGDAWVGDSSARFQVMSSVVYENIDLHKQLLGWAYPALQNTKLPGDTQEDGY